MEVKKIDDLTHTQCLEILKKINDLVSDMPSFIHYRNDDGLSNIDDPYFCCSGYTNEGHDKECSVGQLKQMFGN